MSVSEASGRPKASLLLIVSLCLNLALLGVVGVTMWRSNDRGPEPRAGKGGLSAQTLMRLVPAEKDKIEAVLAQHRPRLHELRGDAMRTRAESYHLLIQPDFDAAAFARALAAVQTADAALEAETMKITADSVAVLTPQERALVANEVRKPDRTWLRRFFRRH